MKISLIHSASSVSLMMHVLAKSVRAPQNCSNDYQYLCLRFNNLCFSKVVFGGLLNAVSSRVKKSVNGVATIFSQGFFFVQRPFFLRFLVLKTNRAVFFVGFCPSHPIDFFLFFADPFFLTGFVCFHSVLVPRFSTVFVCVRLASCGLLQDWNLRFWYLRSVETIDVQIFFGNYRQLELVIPPDPGMWFGQIEGIPRTFDSLDCVIIKYSNDLRR